MKSISQESTKVSANIGQIKNSACDSETAILYCAYNVKRFKYYRDQLSKQ
jgi:hypothetical protein